MSLRLLPHCLRVKHPNAQCRQCVASCDLGALQLHNGVPQFDTRRCSRCGSCVLTCPVLAIEGDIPTRCVEDGCLHSDASPALSVKELLLYYAAGITRIGVASAHQAWLPLIAEADRNLAVLGLPVFAVELTQREEPAVSSARRALLGLGRLKQALQTSKIDNAALNTLLPGARFFRLAVDTELCSLCRACTSICPEQAITIDTQHFAFDGTRCVGCRLCVDLCPARALTLDAEVAIGSPKHLAIIDAQCNQCNSHYPALSMDASLCPGCRIRNHLHIPQHAIGQLSLTPVDPGAPR